MRYQTSIPAEWPEESKPSGGARQPAGKHSECDSTITDAKVLKAAPEKVVEAKNADGLVRKAIDTQVFTKGDEGGGGSDHHKRATNSWGVSEPGKGR
jgi:hypothetical protein